jgi:antitoxin HicB
VPALPGCVSQGATRVGALAKIKEAIEAYLESLEAHGDPIPPPIDEEIVEVRAFANCRASPVARSWPRRRGSG